MRLSVPYASDVVMAVWLDTDIDRIEIAHKGNLGWDEMQAIKTLVWGDDHTAIELFPPAPEVVNGGNYRHLWRIPAAMAARLPSLVDEGTRQQETTA